MLGRAPWGNTHSAEGMKKAVSALLSLRLARCSILIDRRPLSHLAGVRARPPGSKQHRLGPPVILLPPEHIGHPGEELQCQGPAPLLVRMAQLQVPLPHGGLNGEDAETAGAHHTAPCPKQESRRVAGDAAVDRLWPWLFDEDHDVFAGGPLPELSSQVDNGVQIGSPPHCFPDLHLEAGGVVQLHFRPVQPADYLLNLFSEV
mmetsp:Transcript_42910/g.101887  ORF Transcript_42910/g.101887 Transcript_42910/m.101887 type:complete len:203 (-) Transcript_42910:539-1147(-)